MGTVKYSEDHVREAQKILRHMLEEEKNIASLPPPFKSLKVVIVDDIDKGFMEVPIPEDLKDKMGDKKVFVIPSHVAQEKGLL